MPVFTYVGPEYSSTIFSTFCRYVELLFAEKGETLVKSILSQSTGVVQMQTVIENVDVLFSANDEVVRKLFLIILSMILTHQANSANESVWNFYEDLASNVLSSNEKAVFRIGIVTDIFNACNVDNLDCRSHCVRILARLITYCGINGQMTLISRFLSCLEKSIEREEFDVALSRILLRSIAYGYVQDNQPGVAIKYMKKYISTYKDGDPSVFLSISSDIIDYVRLCLCESGVFEVDSLIPKKFIQALEDKDPIFELLHIFIHGTIKDWEKFRVEHEKYIEDSRINVKVLQTKMTLLTLVSLASENSVMTFEQIANELYIPESEVEVWVIDSITLGLIEAKIDQLEKCVICNGCILRWMNKSGWEKISENLKGINNGIESSLDKVKF